MKKPNEYLTKKDKVVIHILYLGQIVCAAVCVWCLIARGM